MLTKNLYIVCGPSGSGKTTLVDALKRLGYSKAITTTTRERRSGEPWDAYHFISITDFARGVVHGEFAEYVGYRGNYYGSTMEELNKSCFVILEPCGVHAVREIFTERPSKLIGLSADLKVLEARMSRESPERLQRLKKDIVDFVNLEQESDLFINTVAPLDTLLRVLAYLQECGEAITPQASRYLSTMYQAECPD